MIEELRTYLDIIEYYARLEVASEQEVLEESVAQDVAEDNTSLLLERLEDVTFKLRSYSEPTGGEYSQGYEDGLEMAAEMLDNIMKMIGEQSGS